MASSTIDAPQAQGQSRVLVRLGTYAAFLIVGMLVQDVLPRLLPKRPLSIQVTFDHWIHGAGDQLRASLLDEAIVRDDVPQVLPILVPSTPAPDPQSAFWPTTSAPMSRLTLHGSYELIDGRLLVRDGRVFSDPVMDTTADFPQIAQLRGLRASDVRHPDSQVVSLVIHAPDSPDFVALRCSATSCEFRTGVDGAEYRVAGTEFPFHPSTVEPASLGVTVVGGVLYQAFYNGERTTYFADPRFGGGATASFELSGLWSLEQFSIARSASDAAENGTRD